MKGFFKKKVLQSQSLYKNNYIPIKGFMGFGSFIVGTGKLITGILTHSFLTCMNAFYTYGMVISKMHLMQGIVRAKSVQEQCQYYRKSGFVLILSSLAYMIYCVKLIYFPVPSSYNVITGLAIATFTFAEIGINIYGIVQGRNDHDFLFQGMKWINLASSLISLVLTQTAILSFEGVTNQVSSNGLLGLLMGLLSTIIGILMMKKSEYKERNLQGDF